MIRWVERHVRGFHSAVGLFLVLGLLLSVLAAGLFAWMAEVVAAGATQRFDEAVVRWLRARTSPALDTMGLIGAALGSGAALWIVLLGGSFFLWRSRHHYSALLLWVSFLGGRVLNQELKAVFDRPRPAPIAWRLEAFGREVAFPTTPSFPSGHAVTAVVMYGTLAYLVARLEPTPRLRRITFAAAAVLVLLIAASRLYLGVHYPSDVVAGLLVGFTWATVAALGIEAIRYFRYRKPEVAAEERDLGKGIRPIREAFRRGS